MQNTKFDEKLVKDYDIFLLPSWEIEKLKNDTVELTINKNQPEKSTPYLAFCCGIIVGYSSCVMLSKNKFQ